MSNVDAPKGIEYPLKQESPKITRLEERSTVYDSVMKDESRK